MDRCADGLSGTPSIRSQYAEIRRFSGFDVAESCSHWRHETECVERDVEGTVDTNGQEENSVNPTPVVGYQAGKPSIEADDGEFAGDDDEEVDKPCRGGPL